MTNNNEETAEILNNYFVTVFTKENLEDIPAFTDRTNSITY